MLPTKSPTYANVQFKNNGTPVSNLFDDVYFSSDNGLAESRYVFLENNLLPNRWQNYSAPVFHIGETGFGTGLNFFVAWQAFNQASGNTLGPKKLKFTSFEKYPLSRLDIAKALAYWPELSTLTGEFLEQYPGNIEQDIEMQLGNGSIALTILIGDVNTRISTLSNSPQQKMDAWFLDGFAPSKNPDMWTQPLFNHMARLSNTDCTLATFTSAGFVRRGLAEAGFKLSKQPGFGHKREMLSGTIYNNKGVVRDET